MVLFFSLGMKYLLVTLAKLDANAIYHSLRAIYSKHDSNEQYIAFAYSFPGVGRLSNRGARGLVCHRFFYPSFTVFGMVFLSILFIFVFSHFFSFCLKYNHILTITNI